MAFEIGSSNTKEVVTGKMNAKKEACALVVCDSSFERSMHKFLLSNQGFKTFIAENGKQAVEMCQVGAHFDLILMDYQMPIMDGVEATQNLREMGVKCKIFAVTADGNDKVLKKRFEAAGANHFLSKPLYDEKLAIFLNNSITN